MLLVDSFMNSVLRQREQVSITVCSSNQMHLLGRPPHIADVCARENECVTINRRKRRCIFACLKKEQSNSENLAIFFLCVEACRSDPPCGPLNISYLKSLCLRLWSRCRINTRPSAPLRGIKIPFNVKFPSTVLTVIISFWLCRWKHLRDLLHDVCQLWWSQGRQI